MGTHRITAKTDMVIFGRNVPAGTLIGILDTDHPVANVLSAAVYGLASIEATGPTAAATENATLPETVYTLSDPQPAAATAMTPEAAAAAVDALNAQPDPEPDPEPETTPEANTPSAPAPELAGLSPRVAEILIDNELTTRAAIADFVGDGGELSDLEGIGPAAARKILKWLESEAAAVA